MKIELKKNRKNVKFQHISGSQKRTSPSFVYHDDWIGSTTKFDDLGWKYICFWRRVHVRMMAAIRILGQFGAFVVHVLRNQRYVSERCAYKEQYEQCWRWTMLESFKGCHVGFLESTCIKLDRLCYESLFTYVLQPFYTPHTTTFVTFCMRSRREHHESLWGDTAGRCVPFSSFVGLIVLRQQLCWDAKHTALGERSERQPTGDGGDGLCVSAFDCLQI